MEWWQILLVIWLTGAIFSFVYFNLTTLWNVIWGEGIDVAAFFVFCVVEAENLIYSLIWPAVLFSTWKERQDD